MLDKVVACFFVILFLGLAGLGVWCLVTKRFPYGKKQGWTLSWKDKFESTLNVADLSVVMIVTGLLAAVVTWGTLGTGPLPQKPPPAPPTAPMTRNVPPSIANPPVIRGPWQAEANGVILTVATVNYGANHLAQVRFRIDNTAVETLQLTHDSFSVVDNFGRARPPQFDASSLEEEFKVAPGQNAFARVQVETPFAKGSTHFDVRLNVNFAGHDEHFTVTTPGIPIPAAQRVEA